MINFACWVNKVDREGNNVFEGGFLGLDNIAVFDRSEALPDGAELDQSDATGWMGMFCLNLMRIALELARENEVYQGLATKFFEHYMYVGAAMKHMGGQQHQLWDEEDGFFYDVLRFPDGRFEKLRVRSLVGLIPLYAVERLEQHWIHPFSEFRANVDWFLRNKRDVVSRACSFIDRGDQHVLVLAVVEREQMRRLLTRMLDPEEFWSPYGLRSLSKVHAAQRFQFAGRSVGYEPGEAISKIKGGNSNWRGPVWMPTSFLMIESLRKLGTAFGPGFTVPCDGEERPLWDVASRLADRLIGIFTLDEHGRRAVHGSRRKFQEDPLWRDLIPFHEYFHADTGEGLGASHQTGWTALVASLIDEWRGSGLNWGTPNR
jgi:Glycosyl hydrolase family 63 C-terminal domain